MTQSYMHVESITGLKTEVFNLLTMSGEKIQSHAVFVTVHKSSNYPVCQYSP